MQLTLENTGLNQTSRTLVQIQNFCHHHNQQVMYFTEMYPAFTGTFSRSGRTSEQSMPTDFMKANSTKDDIEKYAEFTEVRGIHFPSLSWDILVCLGWDNAVDESGLRHLARNRALPLIFLVGSGFSGRAATIGAAVSDDAERSVAAVSSLALLLELFATKDPRQRRRDCCRAGRPCRGRPQ